MSNFKDITLRQFEELKNLFRSYCLRLGVDRGNSGIIPNNELFFIKRYDNETSFKGLKIKIESLEDELKKIGLTLEDVQLGNYNIYYFKISDLINNIIDKLQKEIQHK